MTHEVESSRLVQPDGGVVVGDDGSSIAGHAVQYAGEEARRRGCTLHVIRSWTIISGVRPDDAPVGYTPSLSEFEAATRDAEARRVEKLLGPDPGIPVEIHAVHAPAAHTLIKASETADVLVVGTRGHGGFTNLLLGSVAEQCIRHAASPVVVVRPRG